MSKNIIDRLFETNYFSAIIEAREKYNLSENNKQLKKLISDNADIKVIKAKFFVLECFSLMFEEALEHLNKINDIFNLINKSLFSDEKKEKLKNTVIDIIDNEFSNIDYAGEKFKNLYDLSMYAYGYRYAVLKVLFDVIDSIKDKKYFKITDEIYKNLSHDKLIKAKTVFTRLIIDNNLSNEYDLVKITEHIKNKIDEINNLKTCIYGENLQSFKSGLSDKKLEKLHNELINAGYIAKETDLEAFTKVFSAVPINNTMPVKWIKKATRNKLHAKKALIELLILLDLPKSEYEDKTKLQMCFTDDSNKPLIFFPSNFSNNKDILKNSEFFTEIQTIVKSL